MNRMIPRDYDRELDLPSINDIREAWAAIPPDIKKQLFEWAKQAWDARGVLPYLLVIHTYGYMRQGMPMIPAMKQAAYRLKVPPRGATGHPGKLTKTQVQQYRQRMASRASRKRRMPWK